MEEVGEARSRWERWGGRGGGGRDGWGGRGEVGEARRAIGRQINEAFNAMTTCTALYFGELTMCVARLTRDSITKQN